MTRILLTGLFLFSLVAASFAPARAQDGRPDIPAGTVERAGVGDPGPWQMTGDRTYVVDAFIARVVQDASVTWGTFLAGAGKPFVPPTVVTVAAGFYARSSCGINVGDPREDEHLVPALYCQYGGEIGPQSVAASVTSDSVYIFSPVIYLSVPWLVDYAFGSGASPDLALAYRVVREYSNHIEHILGITDHTGAGTTGYTDEQVSLVAECFTGVWAYSAFDQGQLDLDGIGAAQAAAWGNGATPLRLFGRDPVFGTAGQQREAFTAGYESGSPASCLD